VRGRVTEYVDDTRRFKLDVSDPSYYTIEKVPYESYTGNLKMERRQFKAFLQFLNEIDLELHQ
jgi:hypothetical protein